MKKTILSVMFLSFVSAVYAADNFQIVVKDTKGASREDAYITAPRMADDFLLAGDGFSERCKADGKFSKQISVDKTSSRETYYEVYAVIPGYGVSKRHKVKIGTTSSTPITLTVEKSGNISGKLTLPDGKPAKESYIVLCEEDGTKVDEIDPDSNGIYNYKELPPGKYKLYVVHEPETTNPVYPTKVILIEIKEGEAKKQNVSFNTGTATLTGKFSGLGKQSIVALFRKGEYQNPMSRPYIKQYTDKSEDTYSFQNIEPGNYEFCVIAIDESPEEQMNPSLVLLYHKQININSGENKRDITVPNQPRTEVEGYVTYKNSSAIVPEAIVELISSDGEVIGETTADLRGHYFIKKIPFGKHQVKITRQVRQMFAGNPPVPVLANYEKSKSFDKDFVILNKSEKRELNLTLP